MSNGSQFAIDVSDWTKKVGILTDKVIAGTVLDLSRKIILRTPVDTGQARWNWQASINAPKMGILTGKDASGSKSVQKVANVSAGAPGNIFFLTNNLPYIGKLEYGGYGPNSPSGKTVGGYSRQAPNGMVRVSIIELQKSIDKLVSENR